MDYFKRNRLLLSIIGALVILNLAAVSFIFFSPLRPGLPPGGDPVQNFVDRELGFSQEQDARYAEMREGFFRSGRGGVEAQAKAREALLDLLKTPGVSDTEVYQRASLIGKIETEHALELYQHFRAIRALCSPDQQRKFDAFISDLLNKMRLPLGPGGPGPRQMGPGQPDQLMPEKPGGSGAGQPGPGPEQPREPAPR